MHLNILVVENDTRLAALIADQLRTFGHSSKIAHDGQAALAAIGSEAFDAIVLDRMMPVMDGIATIEHLRASDMGIPTLMLTALGSTQDKVDGLHAGADDYVVKPVDPIELDARLKALVRARNWKSSPGDTVRVGDITISPSRLRVWRNGKDLELPLTEFKLLSVLADNAGSVVTRAMLLERVWDYDFEPTTNIVDSYIRRLRIKLTQFGDDDPILTMRRAGYMLRQE